MNDEPLTLDELSQATRDAVHLVHSARAWMDERLRGMPRDVAWIHIAAIEAYMGAWVDMSGQANDLRALWTGLRTQRVG